MIKNETGSKEVIKFEHVGKVYSDREYALFDVSFSVYDGEMVFVCGESGAGKSTMIKLITCETKPTKGYVTVNGFKIDRIKNKMIPNLRRTLGIVYQDFRLIKTKTAEENVAFAMKVVGTDITQIKKRVAYVMDLVGLSHKLKSLPTELSGGEQQRVAIARAIVNNPSLIIADEPTGNLDPQRSYEIIDLLTKINKLGTTVIVITHDQELLKYFARRIIYLNQGRIAEDREIPAAESISVTSND